jgi:hypothetical protein
VEGKYGIKDVSSFEIKSKETGETLIQANEAKALDINELKPKPIEIKDNYIVTIEYDQDKVSEKILREYYNNIKDLIPNNRIIMVPKQINISGMNKEELDEYLKQRISELENELS